MPLKALVTGNNQSHLCQRPYPRRTPSSLLSENKKPNLLLDRWKKLFLAENNSHSKKNILKKSPFLPLTEDFIYFTALLVDMLKKTGVVKIYFGRKVWRALIQTPWLFSPSKAEKDFGFRAKYSLEEGIEETVQYYRDKLKAKC